jgi:hypothetical protein
LIPAILSVAAAYLGYFTFKRFFHPPIAILATYFLTFSFWPIFMGRQNIFGPIILLWVMITTAALARWFQSTKLKRKNEAWTAGLWIASGFWVGIHWPLIAGTLLFVAWALQRKSFFRPEWNTVLSLSGIGFLIFVLLAYRAGYGEHVRQCFVFASKSNLPPWFQNISDYSSGLFWSGPGHFVFGPIHWGIINPIFGALILLGSLEAFHCRQQKRYLFILWLIPISLLPGLVSRGTEFYRIFLVLIPFCGLGALGLSRLVSSFRGMARTAVIAMLLVCSFGIDAFHWGVAYPNYYRNLPRTDAYAPPFERIEAFQILRAKSQKDGPGLIFNEFLVSPENDLFYTTYPFNAALNPRLDPTQCHWYALLVNANLKPYLQDEFPDVVWTTLAPQQPTRTGGFLLGIGRILPENAGKISFWLDIQHQLQSVHHDMMHYEPKRTFVPTRFRLNQLRSLAQNHRFFQLILWEKTALTYEIEDNDERSLWACENAWRHGYPSAHLFFKMGMTFLKLGRTAEARSVFHRATQCPLDLTPSQTLLIQYLK